MRNLVWLPGRGPPPMLILLLLPLLYLVSGDSAKIEVEVSFPKSPTSAVVHKWLKSIGR